jgi:hypothetical protein
LGYVLLQFLFGLFLDIRISQITETAPVRDASSGALSVRSDLGAYSSLENSVTYYHFGYIILGSIIEVC